MGHTSKSADKPAKPRVASTHETGAGKSTTTTSETPAAEAARLAAEQATKSAKIPAAANDDDVRSADESHEGSPTPGQTASVKELERRKKKSGKVVVDKPKQPARVPPLPLQTARYASRIPDVLQAEDGSLKFETIDWGFGQKVLDSDRDIVAIRCRKGFVNAKAMYNNERGWVREILNCSPVIKFIHDCGSYPLIIAQGFKSDRVNNKGVGITNNNVMVNGTTRSRTLDRISTCSIPAKRRVIQNLEFDQALEKSTEAQLIQCDVYAPQTQMSELALKMRHHAQANNGKLARVKGWLSGAQDEDACPDHFHAKRSYIDGLDHAIVHITQAQKNEFESMPLVLIIPSVDVVDNKVEDHQIVVRYKNNISVAEFHAAVDKCVAKKHAANCTYVTYKTAIVTLKAKVDRPKIAELLKDLASGSSTAKAAWHIVPHTDSIPSPQEAKLTNAKRTVWGKGESPPSEPQPVRHRRYMGIDGPCDKHILAAIVKTLGFTLLTQVNAAHMDTPLRWMVEFDTLEEATAMEGAENAVEVELPSGKKIILEVMPPSTRQV